MARFEGVEGNLAVLPFVIHSCVWYGWESRVRATKPSAELWIGWRAESDSLNLNCWQSRVFVWSPLFTKTCRFFPIADIKNLVDTDQLEWWLIICLRGIASCQHFPGWNKGESFKLFHCCQWIEVFSLVFSFVGRKTIFQLLFMCSGVSGCAQAKQVLSSHIFFPTLTLPSSTLCCSFVVVTSQLISPTSVTVRLASSLPS